MHPVRFSYSAESAAIQQCFSLTTNQRTVLSATINQRNEQADGFRDLANPSSIFLSKFEISISTTKKTRRSSSARTNRPPRANRLPHTLIPRARDNPPPHCCQKKKNTTPLRVSPLTATRARLHTTPRSFPPARTTAAPSLLSTHAAAGDRRPLDLPRFAPSSDLVHAAAQHSLLAPVPCEQQKHPVPPGSTNLARTGRGPELPSPRRASPLPGHHSSLQPVGEERLQPCRDPARSGHRPNSPFVASSIPTLTTSSFYFCFCS
jgi:hypothetical protein